jgi:transposase
MMKKKKKKRSYQALERKRRYISGKTIIGIDPSKDYHQVQIIDTDGIQIGDTFTFAVNYDGYHKTLWKKLERVLPDYKAHDIVFAIERSCNLWQTIVFYLRTQAQDVVLVSPLSTHQARPMINQDFSHTDPKDALAVASNARDGYFDFHRDPDGPTKALHQMGITYDKLRKSLQQNKSRLRSHMEQVFPEFLKTIDMDLHSARYLLGKYVLPEEYLSMDIEQETPILMKISKYQHGQKTLAKLQQAAQKSIGVKRSEEQAMVDHITINSWLAMIEVLEKQIEVVTEKLIKLAKPSPYFECLISIKGISDLTAALFLAETYNIDGFTHYKQIEKLAGLNIRLKQSGRTKQWYKRLSKIGNARLRWVLYTMTNHTSRHIPEVRIKYLNRQLKRACCRKNVVASIPKLLELIMTLVKEKRPYQMREDRLKTMRILEDKYLEKYKTKRQKNPPKHAA